MNEIEKRFILIAEFINTAAGKENNDWLFCIHEEMPKQENGYDCGVFICEYAEYFCKNLLMDFNNSHMQDFRKKIAYDLYSRKLS